MLKLSKPNISEEAIDSVVAVLRSGQLVHGAECQQFEIELGRYLDTEHAILVSSGTAALHLALLTLGVGPGDEVLVPDFTFPATANVVAMVGATPILVDVEPNSYSIDASQAAAILSNKQHRAKAIIVVHEFGYPVSMRPIMDLARQYGLFVVEDAACALGTRCDLGMAGTIGDIGCFSFHPRKSLTTGEGGAVITHTAEHAAAVKQLRDHGIDRSTQPIRFLQPGLNYRMTNFQAALGRPQLRELTSWQLKRKQLAAHYDRLLAPLQNAGLLSCPTSQTGHAWQTYMVVLAEQIDRDAVIATLAAQGIESNFGAHALSTLGIYQMHPNERPLTVAQRLFKQGLALPFCESYSPSDLETVTQALSRALGRPSCC